MSLPVGTYYLYYQPDQVQFYLTLDPNVSSQEPSFSSSSGAVNQQWEVSGDQGSNTRHFKNVGSQMYIARTAADLNATQMAPTPMEWFLGPSDFGEGWYR